ncbi:MAG: hypothetical protein KAI50_14885 [Desulfobacterales bacterium]|nr:hypothetical protein [Desulfobacterales bacterium]
MAEILSSPWVTFLQAVLGITGTWLLAFGLKSVRKAGGFNTSNPQPLSSRFWVGLILLTLSLIPHLLSPFMSYPDQKQSKLIDTEAIIVEQKPDTALKSVDQK